MNKQKLLGKELYNNGMFKVVYMDFGVTFGELYGIFNCDAEVLSLCTVCSGARSLKVAVRTADYLYQLNKYGAHKHEN